MTRPQETLTPIIRILNAALLGRKLLATTAMTMTGLLALTSSAWAVGVNQTPQGGNVVAGSSVITYGPSSLTVNQTTSRSVITWDSFNLGTKASATFNEPTANSLSVERVTGGDPSQIYGTLNSNGQIMILDPNGVFFSRTATVDVNGIIASTGTLNAANQAALMQGKAFQLRDIGANPHARVSNAGTITAAQGGLVAFVAPWVANSGVINAKLGTVTLAAGSRATVDLNGDDLVSVAVGDKLNKALVENSGRINAQGGRVTLSANAAKGIVDSLINMTGIINATSFKQQGGSIILSGGPSGNVSVSGKLNVSGRGKTANAGTIAISGKNIQLKPSSVLSANGGKHGNGGHISVLARNNLQSSGSISATGGSKSGNGGLIETSGAAIAIQGSVNADAPHGLAGSWLMDPSDLDIVSSATANVSGSGAGGDPFLPTGGPATVSTLLATTVDNALNLGTNVYITTVGSPAKTGQDGTVDIMASIAKTAGGDGSLNVDAAGNIILDTGVSVTSTAGKLGIDFTAGKGVEIDGSISTNGGSVVTSAAGGNTVITGFIDAQGGDLNLQNSGYFSGAASSLRTAGAGAITLNQNAVPSSPGIQNAIDALQNGGTGLNTLNLGAGVYSGGFTADQNNLAVEGAMAGIAGNAPGRGIGESSIVGAGGTGADVTGANVTLDGLSFSGFTDGVSTAAGAVSADIKNNIFTASLNDAVQLGGASGTVQNNAVTGGSTGIEVDGNANQVLANVISAAGTGILLSSASNTAVTGNTVTGSGTDGIEVSGGAANVLTGNTVLGSSFDGIYVTSTDSPVITGNTVGGAGTSARGGNGIDVENVTSSAEISGNVIYNVTDAGVALLSASAANNGILAQNVAGLSISGNDIGYTDNGVTSAGVYNINGDGIHVDASSFSQITGNTITNTTANGIYLDPSNGTAITGNTVSYASFDGIDAQGVSNVVIDGNKITTSGSNGIEVFGGAGNGISGNTVLNSGFDGILVTATDSPVITGNTIGGAGTGYDGGNGIQLVNVTTAANVSDNVIYDISDAGAVSVDPSAMNNGVLAQNVAGLRINGNYIGYTDQGVTSSGAYNINGDGILVDGSSFSQIDGNTITNTATNGIYLDPSNGTAITGNTVSYASYYGINAQGSSDLTISGNTVSISGNDGIQLTGGTGNSIVNNTVAGAGFDGIYAYDTDSLTVSGNTVSDAGPGYSGGSGIDIRNVTTSATIDNNIIYNISDAGAPVLSPYAANNGIYASNAAGLSISGNDIGYTDNGVTSAGVYNINGDGIHVDASSFSQITGNTITNTTANGIYLDPSNGTAITGNTVSYASFDGIDAQGVSNVVIDGNKITTSGSNGIEVFGGAGNGISGNTVLNSGFDGILVTATDSPVITGNTIGGAGTGYDGGNGIQLVNVTTAANVSDNVIYGISDAGAVSVDPSAMNNGILAQDVAGLNISGNDVGYTDQGLTPAGAGSINGDGIQVDASPAAVISGNQVTDMTAAGIQANNTTGLDITGNTVQGAAGTIGIGLGASGGLDGDGNVTILGNTIAGNDTGLQALALNNGAIDIEDNVFTGNNIASAIGSGVIDLTAPQTGIGNTFTGGTEALLFQNPTAPDAGTGYTGLSLLNDTLGAQVFQGQTLYYIDFKNGAFFEPGEPTIIDGALATYDGVPGGALTAAQLAAINAKIHDYHVDPTLGLVFPGSTTVTGGSGGTVNALFNYQQILPPVFGNRYNPGRAGVMVTGLPFLGSGGNNGLAGTHFFSLQDLSNLTPSGGGKDNGPGNRLTPDQLASILPAAGGGSATTESHTVINGSCWGNVGKAGGGSTVNIDLNEDPTTLLAERADCRK